VVGLCCALVLRRRGHDVTVVDAAEMGSGASAGNGGWICPSLAAPVPGPGLISQSLRWMLHADSPLLVRPGLDFGLWAWLGAFARRCNAADFTCGLNALAPLAVTAPDLFSSLLASGVHFEHHRDGLLLLFRTESAAREELAALREIESLGYPAPRWMDTAEMSTAQPATLGGPAAALYAATDQHVRPESLTRGLVAWLAEAGVELLSNTPVTRLKVEGRRVIGAETNAGDAISAGQVVVAAGVDSAVLVRDLGVRLPLRGGKGYSVTFASSSPRVEVPLHLSEAKVAISPFHEGVRVLGTMELGTDPRHLRKSRVDAMLAACGEYLPGLSLASPAPPWCGQRPMVPDGLPVIGSAPGWSNLSVATGHAMLGVTLGPATGELIADAIEGRPMPEYARSFSPSRF
jgi:D-amino-acid dehydrogenase